MNRVETQHQSNGQTEQSSEVEYKFSLTKYCWLVARLIALGLMIGAFFGSFYIPIYLIIKYTPVLFQAP